MGVGSRPLERAKEDGRVSYGLRQRTRCVLITCDRNHTVTTHAPDGRLDADQHVLIGGTQNRPRRFGPHVACPQACRGTNAGARSPCSECRATVSVEAWIPTRIVRIEAVTANSVVVGGHRCRCTGHPVRQFGHAGLGDHDRTGSLEIGDERGFVGRHVSHKRQSSTCGRHVCRVDVVFHRDGNAVQRPSHMARAALAVEYLGFAQGIAVHVQRRVQEIFVGGNSR